MGNCGGQSKSGSTKHSGRDPISDNLEEEVQSESNIEKNNKKTQYQSKLKNSPRKSLMNAANKNSIYHIKRQISKTHQNLSNDQAVKELGHLNDVQNDDIQQQIQQIDEVKVIQDVNKCKK